MHSNVNLPHRMPRNRAEEPAILSARVWPDPPAAFPDVSGEFVGYFYFATMLWFFRMTLHVRGWPKVTAGVGKLLFRCLPLASLFSMPYAALRLYMSGLWLVGCELGSTSGSRSGQPTCGLAPIDRTADRPPGPAPGCTCRLATGHLPEEYVVA